MDKVIHYELFFFYIAGYKPKHVIKDFGYSRGTAYRFYHIYREARIRARTVIEDRNSVSPQREKKPNTLDYLIDEIPSLGLGELNRLKGIITRKQKELKTSEKALYIEIERERVNTHTKRKENHDL
ncbi:MAG: hypothetical protein ABIH76_03660 [Candidatus Bathyarchaeota archaeon]